MVKIKLHRNWGDHKSSFGALMRIECYTDAHNYILKVNNVFLSGPANEAGLTCKDYILGTREIAFKSLDEFAKYVEVNLGQEIRLYVYSEET